MDQLSIPVDVVGHLLLLLSKQDIRHVRCVCTSWKQAVDHELRVLRPLYLPASSSTVFSSCESVQLPLMRLAGPVQQAGDAPVVALAILSPFGWQAPMRTNTSGNLDALCSSMQHAAEVDLTGQLLPSGCVPQLAQHLTRLVGLNCASCSVQAADLRQLSSFHAVGATATTASVGGTTTTPGADAAGGDEVQGGGLRKLSLAGVQIRTPPPPSPPSGKGWRRALTRSAQQQQQPPSAAGEASSSDAAGSSGEGSVASDVLAALATNPLTHLNLEMLPRAHTTAPPAPGMQWMQGIPVLGCCSLLVPLHNTLVSLNILDNPFDAQDLDHMCQQLSMLTELHISWDDKSDKLCLDAACFSDISKLRRLQNLALHFAEGSGMAYYEPYTLAPLAQTLTALDLNGTRSLPLVLSITDCTNLRRLKLTRVTRAAGTPEMIVEVARSLPLLQELQLASITGRIARMWPLGDYLLAQLDCCCPHLTKLVMRDAPLGGTGIRMAATSIRLAAPDPPGPPTPATSTPYSSSRALPAQHASFSEPAATDAASSGGDGGSSSSAVSVGGADAAAPAAASAAADELTAPTAATAGMPGSGALRRLKHLELNMQQIMCSTLPHLSYLTALQSLKLCWMSTPAFTHACRYDCFRFASALTNLTSLSVMWSPHSGGARLLAGQAPPAPGHHANFGGGGAGGAGGGAGGNNWQGGGVDDDGDDADGVGGMMGGAFDEIDLFLPGEEDDSDSDGGGGFGEEDEDEGSEGESSEESGGSGDESSGEEGDEDLEDVEEQQQQQPPPPGAAAAGQQQQQPGGGGGGLPPGAAALLAQVAAGAGGGAAGAAAAAAVHGMLQAVQQAAVAQVNAGVAGAGGAGALQQPPPLPPQQAGAGAGGGAGGAAAQAIVAAIQNGPAAAAALAPILAQAIGIEPAQGQALMQLMQHQVVGGGGGAAAGVQQQAGVQGGGQRPPARRVMEPHLHFLGRLPNLVFLNLSSLETRGACLMHLAKLTRLETLILSGPILLSPAALFLLRQLRLPSVKHVSLTNAAVDTSSSTAGVTTAVAQAAATAGGGGDAGASSSSSESPGAAAAAAGATSSSGTSSGSQAAAHAASRHRSSNAFALDRLVPVLCAAFPCCKDLKLGSCSSLSIAGLAGLLQNMPKLQRLWLVATWANWQQQQKAGGGPAPAPFNYVPAEGAQQPHQQQQHPAKKGCFGGGSGGGRTSSGSKKQQPQPQQQHQDTSASAKALVSGYVLPYDPSASAGSEAVRPQSVADFSWFLENAVVVGPTDGACSGDGGGGGGGGVSSAAAAASGPTAGSTGATSTVGGAGEEAAGAGVVPAGAVRLPCVAVGSLKYVSVAEGRGFTRYLDRMVAS